MTRTNDPDTSPIPSVVALVFCAVVLAWSGLATAGQLFIDPMFGVTKTSNIEYGTNVIGGGGSVSLTLDLYQPTGAGLPDQLPAIVFMHGGGFMSGSKTDSNMVAFANAFASRGYVAASINYRLLAQLPPPPGSPLVPNLARIPAWVPIELAIAGYSMDEYQDTIAAAVEDEAMAVNWLVANAATYNIDSNQLAAGGYSAGAIGSLGLGAGIVDGVTSPDLKAVFSLAGGLFGSESVIDSSMPAVYFVHGDLDTVVPFSELAYMQTALGNAGVPYESLIVPGADHVSPLLGIAIEANQEAIYQFMVDHLQLVPEPSTSALAAIGVAAWAAAGWRRSRSRYRPSL
jgi:acetyl esterase/lipase